MTKYRNREELFKASQSVDENTWNNWVNTLTVPAVDIVEPLYHISFKSNLPSTLRPQPVFATGGDVHEIYNEPLPPRISTSTTILGCWRGIYANFSDLFERDSKVKDIEVHVYRIYPDKRTRVLKPTTASEEWLLYDAHNTNEYCVFGDATSEHLGYVTVANTSTSGDSQWDTFYPFDNKKYGCLFSNPPFKILHSTINDSQLSLVISNEGRYKMSNWKGSLEPGAEGKRLEDFKLKFNKVVKTILGPNQTERVQDMERNLKQTFSLTEVKKLSNPRLAKLCEECDNRNKTTVSMSDIATAYLAHEAFSRPMLYLSSIMCGNRYPDVKSKSKNYLIAVHRISISTSGLTTQEQITKHIDNIEEAIELGNTTNKHMAEIYQRTKQQSVKHLDPKTTYTIATSILEHLMIEGGTVTQQSTNEYVGIMLDELMEHEIVEGNSGLLNRAKNLLPKFNKMYVYSTSVDNASDEVWEEWQASKKICVSISDIYSELNKMNKGNESIDWSLSLTIGNESAEPMTTDSILNEWGAAIRGWQEGIPYTPGLEDDDDKDMGEVSDGDHTFNELYMHRTTLFNIILCQNKDKAWKSKLHDDGTMFDNYFIAGITTPEGEYTYHQHMDWWDKFDVEERERAPEWDGHKPEDITRLYSLLK